MSKEAKYTVYFVGFLCFLIFIAGLMTGCESKGDEVFIRLAPDTIVVKSAYNSYGVWSYKEIYTYVNDGKFHIERKECIR